MCVCVCVVLVPLPMHATVKASCKVHDMMHLSALRRSHETRMYRHCHCAREGLCIPSHILKYVTAHRPCSCCMRYRDPTEWKVTKNLAHTLTFVRAVCTYPASVHRALAVLAVLCRCSSPSCCPRHPLLVFSSSQCEFMPLLPICNCFQLCATLIQRARGLREALGPTASHG